MACDNLIKSAMNICVTSSYPISQLCDDNFSLSLVNNSTAKRVVSRQLDHDDTTRQTFVMTALLSFNDDEDEIQAFLFYTIA